MPYLNIKTTAASDSTRMQSFYGIPKSSFMTVVGALGNISVPPGRIKMLESRRYVGLHGRRAMIVEYEVETEERPLIGWR